jgi:hypothetical protein
MKVRHKYLIKFNIMKKLVKGALFLAIVATVIVGCEKEDSISSTEISDNNLTKDKTVSNKDGSGITYISANNFDVEFDVFAELFFGDHPEGLIELEYLPDTEQYALTTEDTVPIDPITNARVICRSSDLEAVLGCLNRHHRFAIGFDGCDYSYTQNAGVYVGDVTCP